VKERQSSAMAKKIIIIGAGYAGILTAKKLAKGLKKHSDISITIIDKKPFHTMLTELHEVAADRVDEDSIRISLKKVFAGRKVEVKLDTVNSIDYKGKNVVGQKEIYPYDYLVIAAGSKPEFYGVKGAEEYSHTLWSYEDAIILKDHIQSEFRKASCTTDDSERKRLLTFYVVGAGFTGIEMIGELAEYVPILCEKFDIEKSDVTLVNVDGLSRPIPNLPEKLSEKVAKRLEKMSVQLLMQTMVSSIGNDYIELKIDEKIVKKPTGTVIWAAGIQSTNIVKESAGELEITRGGRIQVDSYLRSTKADNVFVAGDNMYYIPKGEEHPVPQMVENCEQSADVVAENVICAVISKGEMEVYKPAFHGVMVSIGGRYGVAYVGLPNHFFSLPSFFAMFAKHFINIIYFIQVLGWNKVFSYIKHEFFTIRNCRSFVGGHFSNRTPSFLLVTLRIWLGAVWLFEGIMKIVEGWFIAPKLSEFFGGANAWYDSILNASIPTVADTVSSATVENGTADYVGTILLNFDFLGLFKVIFVSGKAMADSTLSDYAFRLNVPLMNWFTDHLILPNGNVQIAMQVFIVLAEIAIGLALMGGLFTSLSAGFSLILQFMFVCTTGLYLSTFWMVFAGIAVLIGAGRTFGLDYYALPRIKKYWKRLPFVRKLYIYND
jgi:NADH:ubiquinone reductase (H+-translocating)